MSAHNGYFVKLPDAYQSQQLACLWCAAMMRITRACVEIYSQLAACWRGRRPGVDHRQAGASLRAPVIAYSILAPLFLLPLPCLSAGGSLDGIYTCRLYVGAVPSQVYVTVNGQPEGSAIFSVAATAADMPIFGYGIGRVDAGVFTGTTQFGQPFSLSSSAQYLTGTVGLLYRSSVVRVDVACERVW